MLWEGLHGGVAHRTCRRAHEIKLIAATDGLCTDPVARYWFKGLSTPEGVAYYVRAVSRSIPPRWGATRPRLAPHTCAPWSVRVASPTKSRKVASQRNQENYTPGKNITGLFGEQVSWVAGLDKAWNITVDYIGIHNENGLSTKSKKKVAGRKGECGWFPLVSSAHLHVQCTHVWEGVGRGGGGGGGHHPRG